MIIIQSLHIKKYLLSINIYNNIYKNIYNNKFEQSKKTYNSNFKLNLFDKFNDVNNTDLNNNVNNTDLNNSNNTNNDVNNTNNFGVFRKILFQEDLLPEQEIQRIPGGLVPDVDSLESGACERLQESTILLKYNKNSYFKKYDGYDMRNISEKYIPLYELQNNMLKKTIIETLENKDINNINKLEILNNYNKTHGIPYYNYAINIQNGGLFNDWNFTEDP
jgi:hypothetical protein